MDEKEFFELSRKLSNLYLEVKSIMLFAEDEDLDQKLILTSVNEIRNAFDHVMRSFADGESLKANFESATGHLYRAGFDAYEVISISIIKQIQDFRRSYSFEAIVAAYPDYYQKIIPRIEEIKRIKVSARGNKTINDKIKPEDHFKEFGKIVADLDKLKKEMDLHIFSIQEADKSFKKKQFRNRIIALFSTIIGGILVYFITRKLFGW
jgi:hypothetical protein